MTKNSMDASSAQYDKCRSSDSSSNSSCNSISENYSLHWCDHNTSSLLVDFVAQGDGLLVSTSNAQNESGAFEITILSGSLVARSYGIELDMEDTYGVALGSPHQLIMTFGDFGTRVYLDGYQVFSCATNIAPANGAVLSSDKSSLAQVTRLASYDSPLSSTEIRAQYNPPVPDIEFAASSLAIADVQRISHLETGSIYTRMRVRGINQKGTIFAASQCGKEVINLSIDDEGILYRVFHNDTWINYRASGTQLGQWNDGNFHDVIIRALRGAVDIYVDGFLELHQPGQYFFNRGEAGEIDSVSIGQDSYGARLFGEVRNGGIYCYPLSDGQIAALSHREELTTTALFDKGFEGAVSYRIPSMVTTPNGVIIAGADQRIVNPNDTPNEIHFVIRRSEDGGTTWLPMQTVIAYPSGPQGPNVDGPSFIDSCMVVDRLSDEHPGRVIVIVDHFPGGVGFANAQKERGTDAQGRLILFDRQFNKFYLNSDGSVESDSADDDMREESQRYHVDDDGYVTYNSRRAGNIFFKEGTDPQESLLTARTSYLVEVHSDDDGATWSKPRYIDWMLREEWMKFIGTGPGCGIQLTQGKFAGRLLVPFYCCGDNPVMNASGAFISDDGGETWRRGECVFERQVNIANFEDNDFVSSESVFVETKDGSVITFFRNQNHAGLIGKAISHDGGQTWEDIDYDHAVPDIFSQPNAITLPDNDNWNYGDASDRVLFANASLMRPYRGCGVLRYSDDGAQTWSRSRCFNPYHYVYQCMSVRPDGDIGLLWERETAGVYYTHITRSWLGIE
ncbi:sialidase family protein [Alloscardovia theropitheci]|nr:sialidase family protein [Alloscardovia theropitheci]